MAPAVTVANRTASQIVLSWAESGTASSFDVVRDGRTIAASITAHTFTDIYVVPLTFYRYQVVAKDSAGRQATSATVTTSTPDAIHLKIDVNGDGAADEVYVYPHGHIIWTFLSLRTGKFQAVTYQLATAFDATSGIRTTSDVNATERPTSSTSIRTAT